MFSSAIYAVTDEIHQSFSLDRGPRVLDVVIDFGGAFFGVLIFVGLLAVYKKYFDKKTVLIVS